MGSLIAGSCRSSAVAVSAIGLSLIVNDRPVREQLIADSCPIGLTSLVAAVLGGQDIRPACSLPTGTQDRVRVSGQRRTGARRPDDAAVVEVTGSGSTFTPSSPRALFPTYVTWFENQATGRYAPSLLHARERAPDRLCNPIVGHAVLNWAAGLAYERIRWASAGEGQSSATCRDNRRTTRAIGALDSCRRSSSVPEVRALEHCEIGRFLRGFERRRFENRGRQREKKRTRPSACQPYTYRLR